MDQTSDAVEVQSKLHQDNETAVKAGRVSNVSVSPAGGACERFGTLPPLSLAALLGGQVDTSLIQEPASNDSNPNIALDSSIHFSSKNTSDPILPAQPAESNGIKRVENQIDTYPRHEPITTSFDKEEVLLKWVYKSEDGRTINVPSSTRWVTEWFLSKRLGPPSFAPSFREQSVDLAPQGRCRITKKLLQIRDLCTGQFQNHGDVIKTFFCAWNQSALHQCQSVMHVVMCSSHLDDQERKQIEVQCVWTLGCSHHRQDRNRGVVRRTVHGPEMARTPNGVCLQYMETADPLEIAAGNRSFGYTNSEAARRALFVKRKDQYKRGHNVCCSIMETAKELAFIDIDSDRSSSFPFYGCVHDIDSTNTGELNSVSLYHSFSVSIAAAEIKGNSEATAVIDCTGGLVRDLWLSLPCDMVQRVLKNKGKKLITDKKQAKFDVLNFHLVLPLCTGPFVALEAILIGRTASTFIHILSRFKQRLAMHGSDAEHIKYFMADMAIPFAIAVVHVFNRMNLPEYMALLVFSAKAEQRKIVSLNVRTIHVWCAVHGDRAMRDYAREAFKRRQEKLQKEMIALFRNIRMALVSAKSYRDLCMVIAFVDCFTSLPELPVLPSTADSIRQIVVREAELIQKGEKILWEHLGGVPNVKEDHIGIVKLRACLAKGYNSKCFEEAVLEGLALNSSATDNGQEYKACDVTEEANTSEDEISALFGIKDAKHGVFTLSYGSIDIHMAFREIMEDGRARYRAYVPSLSLLPGSIGGFNVFCEVPQRRAAVVNEVFMEGKATSYLRKQWFCNVVFFCPVFTGEVPLSHNSAVEVSYKIKKHHTEIGLNARQRKGLAVEEYVKEAGLACKKEAARVIAELSALYRKRRIDERFKNSRKVGTNKEISKVQRKRKTLDELSKGLDPVSGNSHIIPGVFIPKKKTGNAEASSGILAGEQSIALSQLTQTEAAGVQEGWRKRGKQSPCTLLEKEAFRDLLRRTKDNDFHRWTLRRIAAFFTEQVLWQLPTRNGQAKSIDSSALSRILSGQRYPAADVLRALKRYITHDLPSRCVDNEDDHLNFELLPRASKRVDLLLSSPTNEEREPNILSNCGDSRVDLSDLRGLVCSQNSSGFTDQIWMGHESINILCNFFSTMKGKTDVFYFSSLFMKELWNSHNSIGKTDTRDHRTKEMAHVIATNSRDGQAHNFGKSDTAFAPCQIKKHHWIGLRADKNTRSIVCVNSFRSSEEDHGEKYGKSLAVLLSSVDNDRWEYIGEDLKFPQTATDIHSGVLVLLEARRLRLGIDFGEQNCTDDLLVRWRRRFACEILYKRTT